MPTVRRRIESVGNCPPNLSYAHDIRPLFRQKDIDHMKHVTGNKLDLSNYQSTSIWAQKILERLQDGTMPPAPDAAWTPRDINTFTCWIQQGTQP
jgi:hypothetical protein